MKKLLIILFLHVVTFSAFNAQDITIQGNLMDTIQKTPLANAVVTVIRMSDSVLLDFQRTNAQGNFSMTMPMDTVEILITHPRFSEKNVFFFPSLKRLTLDLPNLSMPPIGEELGEIMIVANKEPVYFRGDTLIYNADAFDTKENAVVEDLLKKLPGITVDKDGKISSQGRTVSKVLVDGDEFFGDDPTIATKNLGADGVESVKVYETEDEDAEAGSDEKIQVMDLRLKEDAKKGYFGRVSAATDFQNFYEGELLLNRFSGKRKISVFALGSNTPRSGFDWAEANKFGLKNEGNFTWGESSTFTGSGMQGIPRTFKTGIYYTDKLSKKVKLSLDYTYNNNSLDKKGDQTSQYFLNDTTYYTDDVSESLEDFQSHKANIRLEIELDSLTELRIEPSINYSKTNTLGISQTTFRDADSKIASVTKVNNLGFQENLEAKARINLKRKFKKARREFRLKYEFGMQDNKFDTKLKTKSEFVNASFLNDSIDQSQEQKYNSNKHKGELFYSEPIGEFFNLNFDYTIDHSLNEQGKTTFNAVGDEYTSLDTLLTNNFETVRLLNMGGAKLRYKKAKVTFAVGAQVRNIDIDNIDLAGITINQNINNVLPNAFFQYKFSQSSRLNFNYRTYSNQPSVTQLQPVANNTNPNRISIGNLDLKPNFTHSFNVTYNTWKALSGFYVWTQLNYNLVDDAFSSAIEFDNFGRTISKTINVDGNQNGNWYFGAGLPIKKRVKVNPGLNLNYFKNSSLINNAENITKTSSVTGNVKFEYKAPSDSLEFFIGGSHNYVSPTSTLSSVSNQPYATSTFEAGFEVELPWKITLEAEGNYIMNTQRADGFNVNYFILNAQISKRLLPTENLVLSITGNDIFNQNVMASRQVQDNVIIDNRTSIISRYFLVKLSLRFNNNKTHEEAPRGHW